MSNANPLIPQGSLLEQKAKSRPHLRIAIFIVAIHLVFLGGLLMQGCKREDNNANLATNETALPPLDTNALYGTNVPFGTNAVAQIPEPTNYVAPTFTPQAVTPSVPAPSGPSGQEYTVAKGDSFYSIGKKLGVSASAIAKANPGVDSTRLKVGQKLQVPAGKTSASPTPLSEAGAAATGAAESYTVKTGDTLTRIAKAHGTSAAALRDLNGLTTDRINVGQKLKLPVRAAAPEAAAPAVSAPAPFAPFPTNAGLSVPPLTGAPRTQ
jgi:LysM repeat protein